MYTATGDL